MAKTQTIKFGEFMDGSYKTKKKAPTAAGRALKLSAGIGIPLALGSPVGAVLGASRALAAEHQVAAGASLGFAQQTTQMAVPAGAKEWMGEQTLSALAHVLDPLVDVMVALSFPVASVIVVGSLFYFMFGNSEKAWGLIQNAGLGYVLIQVSPLILEVLKQIGNAV